MHELMSDTTGWGLVVGVFLPWVTALVQQPGWGAATKRLVAVVAAAAAGVATCLANGTLDQTSTVLQTLAAVLVASQGVYGSLMRPSAKAIERGVLNVQPGARHPRPVP